MADYANANPPYGAETDSHSREENPSATAGFELMISLYAGSGLRVLRAYRLAESETALQAAPFWCTKRVVSAHFD